MYLHIITDLQDENDIYSKFNEYRLNNLDKSIPVPLNRDFKKFIVSKREDFTAEVFEAVLTGRRNNEFCLLFIYDFKLLDELEPYQQLQIMSSCIKITESGASHDLSGM